MWLSQKDQTKYNTLLRLGTQSGKRHHFQADIDEINDKINNPTIVDGALRRDFNHRNILCAFT